VRFGRLLAACALGSLFAAAGAAADRERVQIVEADQQLARAAVVRLADLGDPAGWSGGPTRPPPPAAFTCGTYEAKQSDLVLTGSAAANWRHAGLEFDSEAQVLRSAEMVRLDWLRTVTHPGVTACLRRKLGTGLPKGEKLVAFAPRALPKLAAYTAGFRGVIDVTQGGSTVRVLVDIVVFGAGRVELSLITTAPYAARSQVGPAELRLARIMLARAQPGAA